MGRLLRSLWTRIRMKREVAAMAAVAVGILVSIQLFVTSVQQMRVDRMVYSLIAAVVGLILKYVFKYDAI